MNRPDPVKQRIELSNEEWSDKTKTAKKDHKDF